MFNIFGKKIAPIEAKPHETWNVEWKSFKERYTGYGELRINYENFTSEENADIFIKRLEECAKYINTDIKIIKTQK